MAEVRGRTVSVGVARGLGVAFIVAGVAVAAVGGRVGVESAGEEREKVQLRPALVKVPAGKFVMGSPAGEPGHRSDERQHEVTLTHDFYLCQTKVTQAQWVAVMGENPSNCAHGCADDVAVHAVSWEMTIEYLNALSEHEGRERCYEEVDGQWQWTPSCDGYRLPTEAEWEYAARVGSRTAYGFGSDAGQLDGHAWHLDNSRVDVHAVATKTPNPWGFYDVHGNAWEWVWDWYEGDYGAQARIDPKGPTAGRIRVLRGGSLLNDAIKVRSATRLAGTPGIDDRFFGLRCARGPHPAASAEDSRATFEQSRSMSKAIR